MIYFSHLTLGSHLCGASLVTSKFVISAAHCYLPEPLLEIRAGCHNITDKDQGLNKSQEKTIILTFGHFYK